VATQGRGGRARGGRARAGVGPATSWRREGGVGKLGAALFIYTYMQLKCFLHECHFAILSVAYLVHLQNMTTERFTIVGFAFVTDRMHMRVVV
jgi:hypothetical protein